MSKKSDEGVKSERLKDWQPSPCSLCSALLPRVLLSRPPLYTTVEEKRVPLIFYPLPPSPISPASLQNHADAHSRQNREDLETTHLRCFALPLHHAPLPLPLPTQPLTQPTPNTPKLRVKEEPLTIDDSSDDSDFASISPALTH